MGSHDPWIAMRDRHRHAEELKILAMTVLGPVLLAGALGAVALAWLW